MDIHKTFPIDLYKRGLLVYIGSIRGMKKYIHRHHSCFDEDVGIVTDEFMANTDAVTIDTGSDVIIYTQGIVSIPTMVHELSHATSYICKQVGIDPCCDLEAYAYLLEYLTREVLTWISVSGDVQLSLS